MASLGATSQVSIDDILEYTSNNVDLLPGEQTAQLPDFVPDTSPQLDTDPLPPVLDFFQGYQPNTDIFAINKLDLSRRAGGSFVPLAPQSSSKRTCRTEPFIALLL